MEGLHLVIEPIKNEHYDCIDANIVTIAKHFKRNYLLYFYNYFYFNYGTKNNCLISYNIQDIGNTNNIDVLYKYCGIERQIKSFLSKQEVFQAIQQNIHKNQPVMLETDVFYCPWNMLYQLQHITHCFLIIGIEDEKLLCLDPFFTTNKLVINLKELFLSSFDITIFKTCQTTLINKIEIYNLLQCGITDYNLHNIQEAFDFFKSAILSINFEQELKGSTTIYDISILRSLRNVEYKRECYKEMIIHIYQEYHDNELQSIINDLDRLCILWRKLRSILLKCIIKTRVNDNFYILNNIIDEISKQERTILIIMSNTYSK